MPQIKCIKCDEVAKYVSPEDYCQYHWIEWFADGDEDYIQEIYEDLYIGGPKDSIDYAIPD